jgi:hypothetical protein
VKFFFFCFFFREEEERGEKKMEPSPSLPWYDLLEIIVKNLGLLDILNLHLVCKEWNDILNYLNFFKKLNEILNLVEQEDCDLIIKWMMEPSEEEKGMVFSSPEFTLYKRFVISNQFKRCIGCLRQSEFKSLPFNEKIFSCRGCKKELKFLASICKTRALSLYKITPDEIEERFRYILVNNPHYRKAAPMVLFWHLELQAKLEKKEKRKTNNPSKKRRRISYD